MPAAVLPAGRGVHVDDGVDAMPGARGDRAVEVLEAARLEHARARIVLEVPVVDGDADAVEAEGLEEGGVGVGEEVLEELGTCPYGER